MTPTEVSLMTMGCTVMGIIVGWVSCWLLNR